MTTYRWWIRWFSGETMELDMPFHPDQEWHHRGLDNTELFNRMTIIRWEQID